MGGRVVWDEGNWPKCSKHGMSQAEIDQVFANDPMVKPDRTGAVEVRFNAIGKTDAGRFAFIVFTFRDDDIRPISARYMHAKEVRRYEKDQT
jgi:uncharacterized DUF497 family protein